MTRHKLAIGAVALGFTLSALPVFAQRPGSGGEGGRPGGGGGASSDSRPGGGGGGGGDVGSRGGGSTGGDGSSSSSVGSGSSSSGYDFAPAPSRREAAAERAPQRPSAERRGGGERSRGGEPATGRAVPRGTTPSGRDTTTSTSSGSSRDRDHATSSPRDRAVPAYSRPREGRTVTGRATDRFTSIPDRNGRGIYYYSPYPYGYYYDPFGYYGSYWYPGYSLGLGYFYYDPYWYGGYGYQGGGYSGRYAYGPAGSLRLKIKPRDAQVFVDGYFVGNVDSFDGVFQRLSIEAGGHKIEIRAPGYETLQFDVLITPGETVTYKGELVRIQ
jgi:hypothetical protein